MVVGIKYCGGCNCRYERNDILDRLKKEHGEITLEYAKEDSVYDFVLVLCGCLSKCASYTKYQTKNGYVLVASLSDYALVEDKIRQINGLDAKK